MSVKLKDKKRGVNIDCPACWSDVTLEHYHLIKSAGDDKYAALSAICKQPIEVVKRFDEGSINKIILFTKFLSDINMDLWKLPTSVNIGGVEVVTNIDIRQKTFGQKILLELELKKCENYVAMLQNIIEIYFQPLLTKKNYNVDLRNETRKNIFNTLSVCDAYAIASNYSAQLVEVLKQEKAQLHRPASNEQIAAGLDMFSEFGVVNVLSSLAGGDVLKYNEVLNLDYDTVFIRLKMSKTEAVFQNNLTEIWRRKNK